MVVPLADYMLVMDSGTVVDFGPARDVLVRLETGGRLVEKKANASNAINSDSEGIPTSKNSANSHWCVEKIIWKRLFDMTDNDSAALREQLSSAGDRLQHNQEKDT